MDIQKRKTELGRLHKKKQRNLLRRKARRHKQMQHIKQKKQHKYNTHIAHSESQDIISNQDELFWKSIHESENKRNMNKWMPGHPISSFVTPTVSYASVLLRDVSAQHQIEDNPFESEYDITPDVTSLLMNDYDIIRMEDIDGIESCL